MFAARHHRPNGHLLSIISTQLGHRNIVLSDISFMIIQNPQKPVAIIYKNIISYQHFPILLKHAFQVIILCILHAALGKSNYAESVPEPFDNSVQTIYFIL